MARRRLGQLVMLGDTAPRAGWLGKSKDVDYVESICSQVLSGRSLAPAAVWRRRRFSWTLFAGVPVREAEVDAFSGFLGGYRQVLC